MKHDYSATEASAEIPERSRSREALLCTLFGALDSNQVRYCVLHSWEELPRKLASDLDLGVHPRDVQKLPFVFRTLWQRGYRPVQCFNYCPEAYYFVFVWMEGLIVKSAAIDIIFEHRRSGLIVRGDALVADRRRHNIFWVSDPSVEFAYLLAKKTQKGNVPARQAQRLALLAAEMGRPHVEEVAGRLFHGTCKRVMVETCLSGNMGEIPRKTKIQPWLKSLTAHPYKLVAYVVEDLIRRIRRWLRPTGIVVAILGPDGVGKSSVAEELTKLFDLAFRSHRIFHWRPGLLGRTQGPSGRVTDPYGGRVRGCLKSAAYLFGFFLDCWLGFLLIIRPMLARSTLVVFDRYFHDVLADPRRYRYGGPMWLARLLCRFVPTPDLIVVLDAPEEVILSRKREVGSEERHRQRESYRQLAENLDGVRLVTTVQGLDKTVGEMAEIIVEHLVQRFQHQHTKWLAWRTESNGL